MEMVLCPPASHLSRCSRARLIGYWRSVAVMGSCAIGHFGCGPGAVD
jgi:hypothetical protein